MTKRQPDTPEQAEPEQTTDPNPRWTALEAEAAQRHADAAASAKRSDSATRYANAHISDPEGEA
jgi:hypothetical protein